MALEVLDAVNALTTARGKAVRCYLNSGQSYTYTLLVTLDVLAKSNGIAGVETHALVLLSSLSESSVKSHLRDLGRKGLLTRDADRVFVL